MKNNKQQTKPANMVTKDRTTSTSYRRNRNYNIANKNLKRMKGQWGKLRPELTHFDQRQLRQQATFLALKDLDTNLAGITEGKLPPSSEHLSPTGCQRANNSNQNLTGTQHQSNDGNNESHFELNVEQFNIQIFRLPKYLQDRFRK